LTIFVEVAAQAASVKDCAVTVPASSQGLRRIGAKIRTGGQTAEAIPSCLEVANFISLCRDAGIFWKATAGLHHPFRRQDAALGTRMHGYLNVLVASVLADVHGLAAENVQQILEDENPSHFRFEGDTLAYGDWSATAGQINAARQRGLRSFGSCSFEEPVNDLRALGLL
jgi:hypothetical protein